MFTLIKHAIGMHRIQSVATLLSVALSSAVILALVLSFMGVQNGLERSSQRVGADLMVIPAEAALEIDQNALLFTGAPVNMYMDASLEQQVAQLDGVLRTSAQFYGQTLDQSCCSASTSTRLIGYDASTDWAITPWADSDLSEGLSDSQVVVGYDMAADFQDGGTILGHAVELAAVLDATGTNLDDSILMDIDSVRALVSETEELSSLWEEYGDPSTLISCVLVDVEDGQEDEVAAELSAMEGIAVIQASAVVQRVSDQMASVFLIMFGAAALLVLATLFQLFARFFSLAWDRRSEIALYRALGASRGEITRLIVGEAGVLIGGGVVCGLVLGALLYLLIPQLLATVGSFPYLAPGPVYCVLAGVGLAVLFVLIGLAAVAWPLARAGRIDPSSAMQTGDID